MFHDYFDYSQKPLLGGRSDTKPGDHGTPNVHNRWFIIFYHVWRPAWIFFTKMTFGWGSNHIWLHTILEDPWPWFWRYLGTAFGHTLSFGLSQFHGHGSWLVSEVALNKWQRTLDCAKNHVQTVSSYLYFMSFNQIFHVVAGIEGFSSQIGWEPLVSTNIHQLHFC